MKKVMVLMAKLLEERTKRFLIPLVIVFLVLLTTSLTYADPVFVFELKQNPHLMLWRVPLMSITLAWHITVLGLYLSR